MAFQYQKDAPIALNHLNLNIRAGEKVAILGSIGSGKTTLLKLAAGLYEPNQGNVMLDGVDLRQIEPHFLRNQVVLLNQAPRLFLGTLRQNLDLARTDGFLSSDQELLNALARFGLLRIIQSHPQGLDMPWGEDGQGLLGGQKQIIALARLTLKQPRVVLLDEPTTGLDGETEIYALNALMNWAHDKTMIVVTHRPQVLKMVNRIVVINNGTVVMDGPRDTVLQHLQNPQNQPASTQQADKTSAVAQTETDKAAP